MKNNQLLRLATRKSKLALTQARAYAQQLMTANPGLRIEEVHVVTSGDKFQNQSLQALGGKGLFIKEIEEALLDDRADFAVHSIKDVPAELAPGLELAAIPAREDPRDAMVTREGCTLADLPMGARVGTSSLRRRTMLLKQRADLQIAPLRGNVDTRLRKLEEGQSDAIVLAYAGLRRLGMADRATEVLSPEQMLPAVGQGALGIESRQGDESVISALRKTDDATTRVRVAAERAFMAAVGGSCHLPVAAYCLLEGEQLWLRAMLADEDGSNARFGEQRAGYDPTNMEQSETSAALAGTTLGQALR